MNNTILPLPNGDFEVLEQTSEQIAAQEEYVRQRAKQRDEQRAEETRAQ